MTPMQFLSRALFSLFQVAFMGEYDSGGSTLQFSPWVQILHPTREQGGSGRLNLKERSSESTVESKAECVIIPYIHAMDVAIRLRRIFVGFYVGVKTENGTKRTSNKPASVGKDVIRWDEIVLPSDRSSRISPTVFVLSELGPTLEGGEVLPEFETNVGELLDRHRQSELVRFVEQRNGEDDFSLSSFKIEILDLPESRVYWLKEELTDREHHALIRYRERQERRDLDKSIKYFEHTQDLCPPIHSSRATVPFDLATAKLTHCQVNDSPPDHDVATNLYRDVFRLRLCGHPDYSFTLLSLGIALEACFQWEHDKTGGTVGKSHLSQVLDVALANSDAHHAAVLALGSTATPERIRPTDISQTIMNDLDEGGEVQRFAALQWIFHPDSCKHVLLNHLGVLFCMRFNCLGDLSDPEKAISMLEVIIQLTSDDHPNKPSPLDDLGVSLWTHYERFANIVNLGRPISLKEDALQFNPDGHPDKPSRLNNLDQSLSTHYEHIGNVTNLEESISLFGNTLQFTPDGHPDKPLWLCNLGSLFWTRYERFGSVVDLQRSVSLREDALQFTPDGHPHKPLRLNNLGHSLSTRYERFGNVTDLERSISLLEDAVQFTPDGHPHKPLRLNNLGRLLSIRYECFGDVTDLKRSISLREDALQFKPGGRPDRPSRLNNLGHSLSTRYERFGDVTDLERSISLLEDAVQFTPDGHPHKPLRINNLGRSLLTRYKRFGGVTDLERSISLFEDALRFTPDGHPDRPLWLGNLGSLFSTHYKRFGDVVDLQKSISLREAALQFTPNEHPHKPLRLNNLGRSLSARYERFGDVDDLERSISLFEDALHFIHDGHPDKPLWLNSLGHSLSTRYGHFGDVTDLERSISLRGDALQFTPDGHPDKPLWLGNLGSSFSTRYKRFGDVVDLRTSISLREAALQFTPDGHPHKPLRLNNLGRSLLTRYERFGEVVDLERSISLFEDAVQSTPDSHPDKPLRLNNLALSLLDRFQRSGDLSGSDISRAVLYSSRAARSPSGRSVDRFQASQLWIRCVRLFRHDSQALLDAYTIAIDLLPQLAWVGLSLHDRYYQLLQAADGACNAAAAALDVHRPELAVEWLEQGRSIVWSQLSQLRTPVDDLRAVYPELAAQFERVSHGLERASAWDRVAVNEFTNHSHMVDGLLEKQTQQHHALAVSREKLLAEIRALPDFGRFLLPKTFSQLSPLTHSGPVVFLNASTYRCDALVVIADPELVVHVPLSNTNYDEVAGMQRQLKELVRLKGRVIFRDDSDRGARLPDMNPDYVFGSILPYLWEKVVSPILEALALSRSGPKLPRIFWCPTGPFSFLLIHAAGLYGTTSNPGPKLSDFAISSYIPTMSALELEPQGEASLRNIRLLAVPQPSNDGQVHLAGVRGEIEIIRKLTSSSPFVGFQEADGTVEDVLSKMTETDWVHFACHGTQDRTNPLDSGFLLAHGRRLKLPDIARLSRPRRGLAFLSACHTATGDEQLSEEAIHIAAGMLLAGYRGAIATMWSIMDNDAPRVAEDVYKRLLGDGKIPDSRQAAEALHHAIEQLRDSGVSFLSWAPFIHVGL